MIPHEAITGRYADETGKRKFVQEVFSRGAKHYDRVGRIGFFGSGHFYRKRALREAGLRPGMEALDVACGTGAVTRAIVEILGDGGRVCGVDPVENMLAEARKRVPAQFHLGQAEALPFPDRTFDFLSMGYALRHVADLNHTFAEYHRVLRPGGRLLILEITRPRSRLAFVASRLYFRDILPRLSWLVTGSRDALQMMSYYWETIDACVPPDSILAAIRGAGFLEVRHAIELGLFSAYTAAMPQK
jgi:demethylmenaquinone methyltransferase/2-methoxy-6-polyprenyl-1,4-benzoquinol methylase